MTSLFILVLSPKTLFTAGLLVFFTARKYEAEAIGKGGIKANKTGNPPGKVAKKHPEKWASNLQG
ncbi:MAG: hypothetical protein H6560_07540 [Lewinellaceae bacterium]|nr:hypothetical protein [Lewinellaceae bacterium]